MLLTGPRGVLVLAVVLLACRGGERQEAQAAASTALTATPQDSAAQGAADFRDPAAPAMRQTAPAVFRVKFETSAGGFTIEVHRDWAPLGADRFYNLARSGYFDGVRFFRVIAGFMAQFGIHGEPAVAAQWREQRIPDDPVKQSNTRGMLSFAMAGPNTRTTQLFISFGDNSRLDGSGFSPFGRVVEGMEVVDRLYSGYGEGAPGGRGPDQGRIQAQGNAYLELSFPRLDYVKRAGIVTN
jgi:peptidyl-prolyl cis-trans isomerase A (cyclophilin A)